jgi:hypothetical protein
MADGDEIDRGDGDQQGGQLLRLIANRQPRTIILENVQGFGTKGKEGMFSTMSPLELFIREVMKMTDKSGKALYSAYQAFMMHPEPFIEMSRPRPAH